MSDFFQVFSLVLTSLCIINLISSIYPNTENKHTLMVVFAILSVYFCVTPVSSLFSSIRNLESFSLESVFEKFDEDSVGDNYTDLLQSVLEEQIEAEIEEKFKNTEVKVILGIKNNSGGADFLKNDDNLPETGESENERFDENKSPENYKNSGTSSLEVIEVVVLEAAEEEEERISEYVREKYEITPVFTENPEF